MEFRVPMRLTFNAQVVVDAKSEEEAAELARLMDIADDGMAGAELIDWEVRGCPTAC